MAAGGGGAPAGGTALPAQQFDRIVEGAAWTGCLTAWATQYTAGTGGVRWFFLFGIVLFVGIWYFSISIGILTCKCYQCLSIYDLNMFLLSEV